MGHDQGSGECFFQCFEGLVDVLAPVKLYSLLEPVGLGGECPQVILDELSINVSKAEEDLNVFHIGQGVSVDDYIDFMGSKETPYAITM